MGEYYHWLGVEVGAHPTDRATHERSPKGLGHSVGVPLRDEDLWSDEIEALVDYGFSTVSRNPSDHEGAVAYRRAIASVLSHMRNGWSWEVGSFMGHRGWMWRRHAIAMAPKAETLAAPVPQDCQARAEGVAEDATEHLLSSPRNAERLREAVTDMNRPEPREWR